MAVMISPDGVDRFMKNSTAPATTAPLMIGCWATSAAAPNDNCLWCLYNNGASFGNSELFALQTGYGFTFGFEVWQASAGADQYFGVTPTLVANAWYYILARQVSATNHRLSVLCPDGSIVHASDTTSAAPTGINTYAIGTYDALYGESTYAWDGNIAELFIATCDIQPDGGQTQEALMRKLAYEGPFSLPHIEPSITEYRSFRSSAFGTGDEVYGTKIAALTTSTGIPIVTRHPPLSSNYRKPNDGRLILTI